MANRLVDGEWRTGVGSGSDDGEFEREETTFRDRIRDEPDARFRPEPGRYHLYVSRACPWAHGAVLVRRLAGLDDAVSMDVVDPYRDDDGWTFAPGKAGCTPDTVNGTDHLREVYVAADPDYTGRVTVPVLWDRREETIVNNESIEVMRMLATEFDGDADLYPEGSREAVDRLVEELYDPVNNGVYRAALAGTRDAYERAVEELFDALDRWDEVLADRRFLAGDRLTLADLRLFATLVRFDPVYYTASRRYDSVARDRWRRIDDYPNLDGYRRDVYQLPGVAETVNLDHIVEHYGSPGSPHGFTPDSDSVSPSDLGLDGPHDRARLADAEPLGPA